VRIPVFDGKRENFQIFELCLKTASMSLGLDALLLRPEEVEEQISRVRTRARTSTSSAQADSAAAELEMKSLAANEHKRAQLAHLLLSHLSENVLRLLMQTVPSDKQSDPTSIYTFLKVTYGMSSTAKAAAENAEVSILQLLSWKWQKGSFVNYVRKIHQRVCVLMMHRKLTERAAKSLFLSSLLLKHVLEQISGKALFSSIHQKFSLMLLEVELPATDIFDLFLADVEQLDIVLSVASPSFSASQKGKPKSGGAPSEGKKVDHGNGGSQASSLGKGPGTHSANVSGKRDKSKRKDARGPAPGPSVSTVRPADSLRPSDSQSSDDEVNCRAYSLSVSIPQPQVIAGAKLFLVDSGASHHCVREKSLFSTFRPGKHTVRIADNKVVPAIGKGTVNVRVSDSNGKTVIMELTEVYLVPKFNNNIFSVEHFLAAHTSNSVVLSSTERSLDISSY
jgi:hypothetical protein